LLIAGDVNEGGSDSSGDFDGSGLDAASSVKKRVHVHLAAALVRRPRLFERAQRLLSVERRLSTSRRSPRRHIGVAPDDRPQSDVDRR
jgi:hypothetical protein